MNKENTTKLLKRFPVLYQDYYSPMNQTCMCWGFETNGDGWFDIIWQLSLAIEEEVGYTNFQKACFLWKKKWAGRWNDLIYKLSPVVIDKTKQVGTGVKGDSYRFVVVEKAPDCDKLMTLAKLLPVDKSADLGSKLLGRLQRMGLKTFVLHPNTGFRVMQVKEKFGTLRFYCPGNDKIYRYVKFAESLSAVTCEVCGKRGKRECVSGWYKTVCKEHSSKESDEETTV